MPALAERTKIKSECLTSTTIEGLAIRDMASMTYIGHTVPLPIDVYAYGLATGSTRIMVQPYLPQPSAKAKEVMQKIFRYKKLPENWDNDGAVPPTDIVLTRAATFILNADELDLPFYFTAPGPNGEIIIEFKNDDQTSEIYFNEDGTDEMILYKGRDQIYEGTINMQRLIEHLSYPPQIWKPLSRK
jgi:hypothetical protein